MSRVALPAVRGDAHPPNGSLRLAPAQDSKPDRAHSWFPNRQ
jgi:hypothetical protein